MLNVAKPAKDAEIPVEESLGVCNRGRVSPGKQVTLQKVLKYLHKAAKRVVRKGKKGKYKAPGIDLMSPQELEDHLPEEVEDLRLYLVSGQFKWTGLREIRMPKQNRSGYRTLRLQTARDRVVSTAVFLALNQLVDPTFSNSSFGCRTGMGRGGPQLAFLSFKKAVENGYIWVGDLDVANCFDNLNQVEILRLVEPYVDQTIWTLIKDLLRTNGPKGASQGNPVSALCANMVLDALDRNLEGRTGVRFVRYMDDLVIASRSKRTAERALCCAAEFLGKLNLSPKLPLAKVKPFTEVQFLGFRLKGPDQVATSNEAAKRLWRKLGRADPHERVSILKGWVNYQSLANQSEEFSRIVSKAMAYVGGSIKL